MAYINNFRVHQVDPPGADQSFVLVLAFTGNAGEPEVRREYRASRTTTAAEIRTWAYNVVAELNDKRTTYTTIAGLVGQTFATLAPAAPAAPTAKQIWLDKVDRYNRLVLAGATGTYATEAAALLADINATYQAGYL